MNVKLPILFGVLWLAFGCFYLATDYAVRGREAEEFCYKTQKIRFSGGCTESDLNGMIESLNFKSSTFGIAGIGFLLTFGFLPILFAVRENQNSKNAVESIMNSDAVKPDYKL